MGGWKDQMPDDDLWRVAMFLTRVKTLPPPVESAWKGKPEVNSSDQASGETR